MNEKGNPYHDPATGQFTGPNGKGTTSYKAEDKKAKKEKMAKELGLNEKGKKALEEDEKEVTNNKAYQFPKLTEEDLKKAKEYGLTLKANFKDGDMVLTGSMENLQDFADEYLGYELSDDFLYNDDEFDYEDLEEQGQLEMVKEKEEPKKNRFEDWNKQVSRSAEIRRAMENARKNGQTPQQVMDSIAKDFDLDPAGEEFKKYKDELLKDTKMNKKTGQHEFKKWDIGSDKTLYGEDYAKMEKAMDILSDKAEGQFKLEDVYEDYGAGMKMTNILRVGEDGETYQFLSPKDWIDIMNADEDEVEGIIDNIINEHIEKYPSLGLKRREEGGVWNYAESKRKHDANINKINDAYARDKIDKKEYWRQIDEEVDRWNEELGKNYDGYNPVIHKSENGKLQVQPQVEASNRNPRAEELDDEQEHQIIQIISNLDDEDLNDVGKVRNILGQELPWTNSVDNAIMKELIRTAKYWKKHK